MPSSFKNFQPTTTLSQHKDVSINFKKKIGEEPFTEIYEGFSKSLNKKLAIKIIDLTKDGNVKDMVEREIKLLKQNFDNPNVISLLEFSKSKTNAIFVTELLEGHDLHSYLEENGALPEEQAIAFINNIINGMKSLQKTDLMHGNLNPSGIIVHQEQNKLMIKFPNFLYARNLQEIENQNIQLPAKTMNYLAPETLKNKKYSPNSEIWALGIILYEMIFACRPWEGSSREELYKNIMTKQLAFPKQPYISDTTTDFISKCLDRNQQRRMGWVDLIKHRLIFRSLFMKDNHYYSTYNCEYHEESPSNANIHFGIKKETATNCSKSFISSTLFLRSAKDFIVNTDGDTNRSFTSLMAGLNNGSSSPLLSPINLKRVNSNDYEQTETNSTRRSSNSKKALNSSFSKVYPKRAYPSSPGGRLSHTPKKTVGESTFSKQMNATSTSKFGNTNRNNNSSYIKVENYSSSSNEKEDSETSTSKTIINLSTQASKTEKDELVNFDTFDSKAFMSAFEYAERLARVVVHIKEYYTHTPQRTKCEKEIKELLDMIKTDLSIQGHDEPQKMISGCINNGKNGNRKELLQKITSQSDSWQFQEIKTKLMGLISNVITSKTANIDLLTSCLGFKLAIAGSKEQPQSQKSKLDGLLKQKDWNSIQNIVAI